MFDPQEPDRQHADYRSRWAQRSSDALEQIRHELDYAYGPSAHETLDIFPARQFNAPLLVFIHGGAWQAFDKSEFAFLAPAFVDAGVSLALLNHDPAPHADPANISQQMLRAIVWLWHNASDLGADPQRLHVGGHGAGAHLAAMLAAAHWPTYANGLPENLLHGALCISGLYDLCAPTLPATLRDTLKLDEATAHHVSPVNYHPREQLPLIAVNGSQESPEFQRQRQHLAQTWSHCQVRELTMPGHHHFSIVETLAEPDSALFKAAIRMMGR